jgi:hypothetical protein
MALYQINLDDALLHGLFQQDGGVARLLEQILNQILQAQVAEKLQTAPYERTEERQGYRNGTYPHAYPDNPRGSIDTSRSSNTRWRVFNSALPSLSAQ